MLDAHRADRNVHVAAEQGQQQEGEHPAGRHADLLIGISEDSQLHDQHEDRERQQEEAEEQRKRDREGHALTAIETSLDVPSLHPPAETNVYIVESDAPRCPSEVSPRARAQRIGGRANWNVAP